jgi:hypothetical protein
MFMLSSPDPGWFGGRFWTADNPPIGARFFYYLKETTRTKRAERLRAERAAARRGEDVFYPAWDSLRAEDREDDPTMILTVTDSEGNVVRRLTGSVSAGLHRVTWNLRYPSMSPIRSTTGGGGGGFGGFGGGGGGGGPYVVPGTYTVSLAKSVDGAVTAVGQPQTFEVYLLDGAATPRSQRVLAFQQQTASLQRAMLGANAALSDAQSRVGLLERALRETTGDVSQISADLQRLDDGLQAIQDEMTGDPTMRRRNEPTPPSLQQRLGRITGGAWSGSLQDVTGIQRRQYEILAAEFGGILERLRTMINVDLKGIEDAAEAAGAPWTSGRLPVWRP